MAWKEEKTSKLRVVGKVQGTEGHQGGSKVDEKAGNEGKEEAEENRSDSR